MAKQIKTFTAGSVLTASDVNSYLMNQAVIAAQSTDRPTSPSPGMTIWETDTKRLLIYNTTTGWTQPWNMPWGMVQTTAGGTSGYGYARITTAQNGITTTLTDVTNASVTFPALAGRLYRVTASADLIQAATATEGQIQVDVDGTINATSRIAVSATDKFANITTLVTLSTGSHVIKLRAQAIGTGTINIVGSAAAPTIFSVEDAGPAV
jgi:hypothetical protein